MNVGSIDALLEADRLYGEYAKLAELGELACLGIASGTSPIVASVSPVLCESYRNAIVERYSSGVRASVD